MVFDIDSKKVKTCCCMIVYITKQINDILSIEIMLMARKELLLLGGFDIPFFMYAVMFSFSKFC